MIAETVFVVVQNCCSTDSQYQCGYLGKQLSILESTVTTSLSSVTTPAWQPVCALNVRMSSSPQADWVPLWMM